MKKYLVLLVTVLSLSNVYASEPDVESPSEAKSIQIVGKVTDVTTGEALVGVSLKIEGSEIKTYSDLNGNFHLEGVTPGIYNIDVDYVSYKKITLMEVSTSSSILNLKVALESVSLPL